MICLFRQQAENTKFKDRQDKKADEHIILLVHNKHKLLKLRNTKRSTLQLTKLSYTVQKIENRADLEKWSKHAKTTGFMQLFNRHRTFI